MKGHRLFIFILAVGVFGILNTEMGVIGLLPYVSAYFGVSISEAGVLVSLFALIVAVSGPIMPLLLSRFERKKTMLFVLAVFIAGNAVSAVTDHFAVLLAARVIPAFFHPVYCALAFSAAAEAVPPAYGPDAVGKVMVGVAAGMVLGVPVSNFLAGAVSLQASFIFFAAVTAAAFVATLCFVPAMPAGPKRSYGEQIGILRRPAVWMSVCSIICMNGALFGVFTYLAEYLGAVTALPGHVVSLFLFAYGISNSIGSFMSGRLLMWNDRVTVQSFPWVLLVLYGLIWSCGSAAAVMAVLTVVWGFLGGVNASSQQYILMQTAPEAKEFASGIFLTSANMGTMAASALCGWCIAQWGVPAVLTGGAAFAAVSILFLRLREKTFRTYCLQKDGLSS